MSKQKIVSKNVHESSKAVAESALLRVSVTAGLQLVFSLLQNSSTSNSPNSIELVVDTLNVALSTLLTLPPLSLSQSNRLVLKIATKFLQKIRLLQNCTPVVPDALTLRTKS